MVNFVNLPGDQWHGGGEQPASGEAVARRGKAVACRGGSCAGLAEDEGASAVLERERREATQVPADGVNEHLRQINRVSRPIYATTRCD